MHFAVDTDQAYMTTELKGKHTSFLPFNLGNNQGVGNPVNTNGYKTSYLWEKILSRESLLDIVAKFIHLEVKEKRWKNRKQEKRQ